MFLEKYAAERKVKRHLPNMKNAELWLVKTIKKM